MGNNNFSKHQPNQHQQQKTQFGGQPQNTGRPGNTLGGQTTGQQPGKTQTTGANRPTGNPGMTGQHNKGQTTGTPTNPYGNPKDKNK